MPIITPGSVAPVPRLTRDARGVAIVALIGLAVLVGGCGGSAQRRRATVKPPPVRAPGIASAGRDGPAPPTAGQLAAGKLLIFFKRAVGADPTASQLTVDTNGMAAALETDGGVQGEHKQLFMMPAAELSHLKRLIVTTTLRSASCCSVNYYTYWVTIRHHASRLQQGRVPVAMRPLIHELDAITDAHTVYN